MFACGNPIVTDAMLDEQREALHASLDSVSASIDRMRERIDWMQSELLAAAEQFARYADYHLAKVPPDSEKAATNVEWAARCREAAKAPVSTYPR